MFGVDDPGRGAKPREEGGLRGRIGECGGGALTAQRVLYEANRQGVEELPAEDLRERLDGEEEAAPGRDPASVGGECAAGDERVHMQVLGEGLAPGVQHEGGGDLAAGPSRVAAELAQRGRCGGEQQFIDCARIALGERVELVRQGEDEVEVGHRQELGAPSGEPAFLRQRLALGAVAVAAGVVDVVGLAAVIAAADLTPQGGGAAALDRAQRAVLHPGQALTGEERRGVRAHDVGEFDLHRPPRAMRGCVHGLESRGVGAFEQLQRRRGGREMAVGEMEVAQRRADVAVAHEPLDRVHVDAGFQ